MSWSHEKDEWGGKKSMKKLSKSAGNFKSQKASWPPDYTVN